jgi:hypothetical protein
MEPEPPAAPPRPDANLIAAIVDHLITAASRYPLGQTVTKIEFTYARPGEGEIRATLNRSDDEIRITWMRPKQEEERYAREFAIYQGPVDLVQFGGDDETVPF